MAENTEPKKVVNHHANMAASEKIDNKERLTTNIGACRGASEKYEIYFLCPQLSPEEIAAVQRVEDVLQTRYDAGLNDLITAGVRKISTGPDYPAVMFEVLGQTKDDKPVYVNAEFPNGNLKPDAHNAGQALADGYQMGRKSAGPTVKAKAAEHDALLAAAAEAGVDIAAVIAAAKAKKNRK